MKKKETRKLRLHRETLRQLSEIDLDLANGGTGSTADTLPRGVCDTVPTAHLCSLDC